LLLNAVAAHDRDIAASGSAKQFRSSPSEAYNLTRDFVHTITFDNGKDFAAHQDIAHALKANLRYAISRMGAWLE
jgi:IS30 family transposase